MLHGILGRKIGMTHVLGDSGESIPVTVVEAGPCVVSQKKDLQRDGYSALQLAFQEKKPNLTSKAEKGHFSKANVSPMKIIREIRVDDTASVEEGQSVTVDIFNEGDIVDVTGVSRGKGTAGVMKRWGFGGGRASHGAEKVHRKPGSIGCSADPGKVFKGRKMPGRYGNKKVTVQNLTVAGIRKEDNILLIKGAVPGHPDGLVVIKKSVKKG